MSIRGYRIYGKTLPNNVFSILVESVHSESFLQIQAGALLALNKDVGNNLRASYTKFTDGDGYGLMGILRLFEGDSYLILITGVFSVGQLYNCDVYKITNVKFISLTREPSDILDSRIVDLQRLLSTGSFYFAYSSDRQNVFDLTLSSQKRHSTKVSDFRFYCFAFNRYSIDADDWLVQCMCGSVLIRTIYVGHRTAKVAIISRLSGDRVGTRFSVRGVNDDGNVANFVETEQLISFEDQESSFVQIRGSVPLFWEQPGINLKNYYGGVATVNLLGSKEGERLLSTAFQTALKTSSHSDVQMISFDYHAQMKQSKDSVKYLLKKIDSIIGNCQFFHLKGDTVFKFQKGVIRTNCLDCLDRTNCVQTLVGMETLVLQMALLGLDQIKANISTRFEEVLRDLWQKNGDQCSIVNAGTGALEGKSKLRDASRSIARTIQNNLMDSSKQESFDLLLLGCTFGNRIFDKASNLLPAKVIRECPTEVEAFVDREREMCKAETLTVFAGTWNVNGGKNMYNVAFRHEQSLESWIFPTFINSNESLDYDIIAIGLEEIVDLNAGNLVKASTTNQRVWRDGIKTAIDDFNKKTNNGKYAVLACEQLVGVCLILYVKTHLLGKIRDLAIGEVKTGMGGATGNKGSVVVRMTIHSTSVCFVCSHFAAGQNEVVNRNDDFQTSLRKVRFPLGRTIGVHDIIFWLGDFNYRINLGGEEVKAAVRQQNFDYLVKFDQLKQQKEAGNVFNNFNEGPLHFAPTYKYDTFSDDYDTSEKCRSPAWTDRVLWCDQNGLVQLVHYGRSELKTSDHRPVYAIFRVDTLKVQIDKCEEIVSDVVCSMGPPDSTILCSIEGHNDSFPTDCCRLIFSKLQQELGIPVLATKIEGQYLHIVLPSGVEALASLSMDQILLENGQKLNVSLRSPNWAETYTEKLSTLFKEAKEEKKELNGSADTWTAVNINLDDDEDDDMNTTGRPIGDTTSLRNSFADFELLDKNW
ncbi:sacI homology domain-containing protein [Ditylenchus destructor]|nr:sacI homology domain-containing protein [Ditylenchus destructor]